MAPKSSQSSSSSISRCSFLNKVAQISKRRHHHHHNSDVVSQAAAVAAAKKSDETIASSSSTVASWSTNSNRSWRSIIIPSRWQSLTSLSSEQAEPSTSTSSSSSKKRRVRFDETQNQYFDKPQLVCEEEEEEDVMEDLWYNSFEHTMFKSKVAIVCARIIRDEGGLHSSSSSNKSNSKRLLLTSSSSYQYLVESIFEECCRCNAENDADMLPEQYENWTKLLYRYPNRLGLEKYIVPKIGADQYERQQQMVEMILVLQNSFATTTTTTRTTTTMDQDEIVRNACRTASLPSRLFARFTALANAATQEDDDSVSAAGPWNEEALWSRSLMDEEMGVIY